MIKLVKESIKENGMIISCGIVIIYKNEEILLCHPTGSAWWNKFSFPKGHIESGENYKDAALRETKEEIGLIINPKDISSEPDGFIDYKDKEGNVYKRIYYFLLLTNERYKIEKTNLQLAEIDYVNWYKKEEAEKRILWRLKEVLRFLD